MLNSLLVKSIIKKDIESGEITGDTSKKMDKENPSGTGSFSMNRKADTEVGANSTTEGTENVASGENSHAEGKMNTSSGNSSHAEGWNSKASGAQAHAEGSSTASGKNSHSEGTATKATSEASHAEGYYTIAGGGSAHAEGNNSSASGNNSHAEGYYAHAEGASSHSEGQYTYSEGTASHSEGEYSKAQGIDSHAEGNRTTALGNTSHSEGSSTNNANTSRIKQDTSNDDVITYWESSKFSIAKGTSSHAEGKDCLALGDYSHSGGLATRAGYQSQTAIGEYNENKEEDIFEVGNGTSDARSNALELTKTGDLKIGGSYIDGSGNALSMDSANEYTDQKIADLINGAPTTLDTLKEIADAMEENQDVVKTLDEAIGSKANASDLTDHATSTNNPHSVTKKQLGLEDAVESEVAIDFSEAETPQFQQTIDDVLDSVNELKGDLVEVDSRLSESITDTIRSIVKSEKNVIVKNPYRYNINNMIVKDMLIHGHYINDVGGIGDYDTFNITPFIKVTPNTYLYGQNFSNSAFYDSDLRFISTFQAQIDPPIVVPNNAMYCRISILDTNVNNAQLNVGCAYPNFDDGNVYLENVITPVYIVDKNADTTVGNKYRNLVDCIVDTYGMDCNIYVRSGLYDLYDEFSHKYGTDFTEGTTIYEGLKINKQKIFCDSGVIVLFDYSNGSIFNITDYFAPIKFDGAGGEWHGGHIIAKNCRYAIHDDVFDTSDSSRTVIDGVVVDLNTSRNIAIGGGLGQSSDVTVKNCIFRQLSSVHGDCRAVYYHNAQNGENAVSNIKITGNYCNYGSIFIHSFGASTKKSTAIVSNNRCSAVTLFKQNENVDNIDLYEFNNKIESD